MTPERWRRLKALFGGALERAPAERGAYLAAEAGDDAALRAEAAALLAAHEDAGAFLVDPTVRTGPPRPPGEAQPRERIGPYRLVRELGHGGMGTVYLAERDDDAYLKTVAVKLIRRGMDFDDVIARFRTERQILAALTHPNIAALLDGGTTDDGLPYFVLEYVDGAPIDRFCDAGRLSVARRLELFLQVCAAVQHAHRSLVVHRDVKPANILVTGEGVPKLLDFGVAKLLAGGAAAVEQTSAPLRFVTPAFASPEALRGGPVTTASDVYSLGALLHVLLTGVGAHARAGPDDLDALIRRICETDPARPSATAVGAVGGPPEERAAVREGTPERLRRRLEGDLDTIVLCALARDPARRYPSVDALADDVRRHLAGHPVSARPATWRYRVAKFAARHRVGLALAALVIAAVAGAFVETARQRARAERRFEDVRALAHAFLFEFHDAIRDLPGSTRVRALIVARAQEYLGRLAREAAGDRSVQRELADAYRKLGEAQGSWTSGLGDLEGAVASLRAAAEIRARLRTADPGDAGTALALSRDLGLLGCARATTGDRGGIEDARRGVALAEAIAAERPGAPRVERAVAGAAKLLADALSIAGEADEALRWYRRAADAFEPVVAADPGDGEAARWLAASYINVASSLGASPEVRRSRGVATGAQAMMEKAVALFRARLAADPRSAKARLDLSFGHLGLGNVLEDEGKLAEAAAAYRAALALREEVARADPDDAPAHLYVAEARQLIGNALLRAGDAAGARDAFAAAALLLEPWLERDRANVYLRSAFGHVAGRVGRAEVALARAARPAAGGAGHWREARRWYGRASEILEALRAAGTLTADFGPDAEEAGRELARCEAALARVE